VEYPEAQRFIAMSVDAKPHMCQAMQLATMIDPFPTSVAAADESMALHVSRMEDLLQLRPAALALALTDVATQPGADDPYIHCIGTLFYHSFYYRGDAAATLHKHFLVASRAFPELLHVRPDLLDFDQREAAERQRAKRAAHSKQQKAAFVTALPACRKLRLGIASGFLSTVSSVTADFGNMLQRLPRAVFDVTFVYFSESGAAPDPLMLGSEDRHIIVNGKQPGWVEKVKCADVG